MTEQRRWASGQTMCLVAGLAIVFTACGGETAPAGMVSGICAVAEDCPDQGAELGCVDGMCVEVVEPVQWDCLGTELPAAGPSTSKTIQLQVDDTLAGRPLAGAEVRVCDDIDCTTLLNGPHITDETGNVEMEVPFGFDGFLLLEKEGFIPMAILRGPVISHLQFGMGMATPEALRFTAHSIGVELPDMGSNPAGLAVNVLSCNGHRPAEAQFELHGSEAAFTKVYWINNFVSPTATETDEAGSALFYGVGTGNGVLVARSARSQRLIGSQQAPTRPGWATSIYIDPIANQ